MGVVLLIVFFFVAFFIVGLVLLQEGKGGGLTGMSTGMDGVMGAKNPLRRMTAYLFVFFVLMCLGINYYFHDRAGSSAAIPMGTELPSAVQNLEEAGAAGPLVVPEGSLRPEEGAAETAPAAPLRPESDAAAQPEATEEAAPSAETPAAPEAAETTGELRPEATPEPEAAAPSVQPPAETPAAENAESTQAE